MFQRRLKVFMIFVGLALGVLVVRLVWLQLIGGAEYVLETRQRPFHFQRINTVRGDILDFRGRELATDESSYELCLHYELTRLYDERFWRRRRYEWQGKPQLRAREEEALIRQKEQADEILDDLMQLCEWAPQQLQGSIKQINDTIYTWRSARARRRYYDKQGLVYEGTTGAGIERDLTEKIPNEAERLVEWIFHDDSDVAEMNQSHRVGTVSKDMALIVEERIVGASREMGWEHRPVSVRTGKMRRYPQGEAGCHLIGQLMPAPVDPNSSISPDKEPGERQMEAYLLGDRRGEWGVESLMERRLRGRRGWVKYDNKYEPIQQIDSQLGRDVQLTIDIELHRRIQSFFSGDNDQNADYRGAAVVIDVPTGQIRALVSAPTFDLNTYYLSVNYNRINYPDPEDPDPDKLKLNRALSENYMPGSIIKPTLLLKALETGAVTAGESIFCAPGSASITQRSSCYQVGHGNVTAKEAIKYSCNNYFIEVARRIEAEGVISWLKEMGFGAPLLAWPEGVSRQSAYYAFRETGGYLQRRTIDERDLSYISVGLRPLEGSVLQMANSMATIARQGEFVEPYLILTPKVTPQRYRVVDSTSSIETVLKGMEAVIYEIRGTAYNAFNPPLWSRDQVHMYGKTGSTGDCSVFGGFARGAGGTSVALAVVVENEGGGGTVAAPIGRRIWQACAELGYLGVEGSR